MTTLDTLVDFCDGYLNAGAFRDYCPNGLQVQGREGVRTLVSGVTASLALVEAAIEAKADAILVHHGYFWKGEDPCVTGMKRRRLRRLLAADISLIAYHLPLDAHPEVGNNAGLARQLGFSVQGCHGEPELLFQGTPERPMSAAEMTAHIAERLGRTPLHIPGEADDIRRVAWCTGAAQSWIEQAVELGVDAFISGEISEQTVHVARECGLHYFAAGHHATERYGVQALGALLVERFGLEHRYIEVDNPV